MEPELEEFKITDWDLENEFNPNRVRRHMTKKQHTYGVFASDESDDERPSFSGSKTSGNSINFISGGLKQNEANGKNEDQDSDTDMKETFSYAKKARARSNKVPESDKDFGNWEKYNKGIGSRLLLKMGYQPGKGLGKRLQGITTPVEAKKRQGKGALGLYGPETTQKPLTGEEIAKKSEETELTKQLHQWKKRDGKKDVKYSYRTLDEINDDNNRQFTGEVNSVKVIDMTGPKQRVLTGYHQIHQQHTKPEDVETPLSTVKNFQLPELEHNINILVNMTEQEILHNNRKIKFNKESQSSLQFEEERLAELLDEEKKQMDTLEVIIGMVSDLKTLSNLDEAADVLTKLQKDYYQEYKLFKLGDLSLSIVFPLMQKHFENWEPLQNPTYGYDIMSKWKHLLETDIKQSEMDPYQQLLWEIWMPPVRKAALSWDPHYCNIFTDLLERWMHLLPRWMFENILDQLIFPNLQKEVDKWNPLTDTVPIHSWIHPWLPLMKNKLEPLYSPIRQKIASALRNWDPSDNSAKLILHPWKTVFSKGTMEAFVITNILPKLSLVLQNFEVNPHHQQLDIWNWIFSWEEFLPVQSIVSLLEKQFFPKWIYALCTWLSQNPNFDEVSKWYVGWKSMFSENLFNNSSIKDFFKRALDIMNQASKSSEPINPAAFYNYYEPHSKQREYEPKPLLRNISTAHINYSFKDIIEKKAQEKGVLFVPIPNRFYDSKQVYRLGNSILYIDKGKIFVNNEKTWVPTSLTCLLDMTECAS